MKTPIKLIRHMINSIYNKTRKAPTHGPVIMSIKVKHNIDVPEEDVKTQCDLFKRIKEDVGPTTEYDRQTNTD